MKKSLMIVALLSSFMLVGCGSDDKSYLRVLHASPDAPAVDVLINGSEFLSDIEYQNGSDYIELNDGTKDLALRVSGTETIVLQQTVTLADDGYYSVIAQNNVANLELGILDDTERARNSTTDVTVVHASPDAGNVDVYVTANGDALPATATLIDVAFGVNASLSEIASADYQVRITGPSSTTVIYDSGALPISSDVTAVAVNSVTGASPLTLLVWSTSVTPVLDNTAEVQIVHAVDSVTVDVYAGGNVLLEDFAYEATTNGYVTVAAGELDVAITAANDDIGNALSNLSGTLTLERGESYTIIAAGDTDDLSAAQLIVLTDTRTAIDNTKAYVRLVHASSAVAADPVDIYVTSAGGDISAVEPNFADVVLGENTGYVELDPATYDVIIAADGTKTAAVPNTDGLALSAGSITTALAIGNGSGLKPLFLNDKR